MDAWTTFGLVKLFLEVIDEGPKAIVKGILMSGIPSPYSEIIDAGEVVFGLFSLGGSYQGTKTLRKDQYISLSNIQLLNKDKLDMALARYDFPKLAQRQLATMKKREFQKRSFPKF